MGEDKNDYTDVVDFYNNQYHKNAGLISGSYHHEVLACKVHPQVDDYVLDIACGTGTWLATISKYSRNIFGVDISETAIKSCKKRIDNCGLCISLGEKLPFQNSCFDLVTCLGSLEHFLDQDMALNEIRRVAKDTARIVILVPNSGFLTYKLGLYKGTNQSRIRETIRSINEWEKMFAKSGLLATEMWADLHVLNWGWISRGSWYRTPFRALQAIMLIIWPLKWQYQVYFLCEIKQRGLS